MGKGPVQHHCCTACLWFHPGSCHFPITASSTSNLPGGGCRLSERQTPSGGLNGRPEKLQDVCYSWWCLSALHVLDRLHWIDQKALTDFILDCQVCARRSSERQGASSGCCLC